RPVQRLLVVAAHGDDETLGAGATLARLSDAGVHIRLLVMTNDDGSRDTAGRGATDRSAAIHKAAEVLGIREVVVHGHGDNRLDRLDQLELNRLVEAEVRDLRPDAVFTTTRCSAWTTTTTRRCCSRPCAS